MGWSRNCNQKVGSMDHYQGVMIDYLRADRAIFVNAERCIQLNAAPNPDSSGRHWYCDAVAADFASTTAFLCEVSYAHALGALLKRLGEWNAHWRGLREALVRDSRLPAEWSVRPWLFIPEQCIPLAVAGIRKFYRASGAAGEMPVPRITTLEMVVPWKYVSWNRVAEKEKPSAIPEDMRV
jgi:hypothetical protein